jgi:hypothetical protein
MLEAEAVVAAHHPLLWQLEVLVVVVQAVENQIIQPQLLVQQTQAVAVAVVAEILVQDNLAVQA